MTTQTLTLNSDEARNLGVEASEAGSVDYDHVASYRTHKDRVITCTSGTLWVTVENVCIDFVLNPGERLLITGRGKVVIYGKGAYRITAEAPLGLAC
ncbi:MAG: DUF2917 domain-containing protein [Holophaga sp.]|jgi:hypothetical protein